VREISQPFYLNTGLLEPGLSDYSYGLGLVRDYFGSASGSYGPPALSAFHRIGLAPWLTVGGRFEAERGLLSGGPEASIGFPLGELDMALAASGENGQGGVASSLIYQFLVAGKYGFGFQTQWMSPYYATLNLRPSDNRALFQSDAAVSFNVGPYTSLELEYLFQNMRDHSAGESIMHSALLSAIIRLSEKLNLLVSVTRAMPGNSQPVNDVFFGLSYMFGQTTVATGSYDHSHSGNLGVVSLQKALPLGPGYGYLFQAQDGISEQQNGFFQYQTDFGTYSADHVRTEGQSSSTLTIAGGLVAIGGRVFPTRAVQNGFALVRVPSVPNVACEWSNQVVARDGSGDCLIPNLLPYFGNQLGIFENDIPLNYSVGAVKKTIAVPYRGGAVVDFPVHKIQQLTGYVVVIAKGRPTIPANGEFTMYVDNHEITSPIGEKGEFYFEDIPPGSHRALVDYATGSCTFSVDVPKYEKSIVKIGTLTCTAGGGKP
jgi:outer membrane usher protein